MQLKDKCDIDSEIALELLVHAGDIITPVEKGSDLNSYWPVIQECVSDWCLSQSSKLVYWRLDP